ncbi:NACHT domain-containing protein [Dictyobacter aurantiacus]|uniref:NACHT domain-containing protein n=1 Tax=Dictyobacter aurantiacus TaxID=1936993 RepID=A0A401ZGY6_9CHLR|nr:NACHT domain-containing protein [Dictyobacter aurantiacus]GCE06119.1 hypothetical protein KDAU_34480 [Dictyobacter aurantiacus]
MDSNHNRRLHQPNTLLKKQRALRGWPQQKVADELGTSVDTVSKWERGVNTPDPYFQEKLIALFNKDAGELGFISNSLSVNKHREDIDRADSVIQVQSHILSPDEKSLLVEYLQHQQTRMLNALAPGSTNLRVKDVVGDKGLFISPPWTTLQSTPATGTLVEYLTTALSDEQRILLLGDAGQGKTTILKQLFNILATNFISAPLEAAPFPIYIPLREFSSLSGSAFEILWNYLSDKFPLVYDSFVMLARKNRIVFFFDGLDEMQGELTQRSLNERAASKLFTLPSILSCRKNFFEFYLSMSPLLEEYPLRVELQPLALNEAVIQYIADFYHKKRASVTKQAETTPTAIVEAIKSNHELQDLAQRPLLLIMMLDIFTDPAEMSEEEWSVTKLYKEYTEKWLKNEAAKPDSVLKWHEKNSLIQEVAWITYSARISFASAYGLTQNETFTQSELNTIVKTLAPQFSSLTETQLLDDLCFRTFLSVSEGENYYFLHKSFHEYYVARYIFELMRNRIQQGDEISKLEEALRELLPFEVVSFLKQMLGSKEITASEKNFISDHLMELYQENKSDNGLRSAIVRQQSSHYLARLGTPRAIQFLDENYVRETNKWVQRGMMVGLALYCGQLEVLDQYIQFIREDPEAASINLGYHLVYYGDQSQESGYYDAGEEKCSRTIKALLRRLSNKRYKNGWTLDILTLSALIESRGVDILIPYCHELAACLENVERESQNQSVMFEQEKERLNMLLILLEELPHGYE